MQLTSTPVTIPGFPSGQNTHIITLRGPNGRETLWPAYQTAIGLVVDFRLYNGRDLAFNRAGLERAGVAAELIDAAELSDPAGFVCYVGTGRPAQA